MRISIHLKLAKLFGIYALPQLAILVEELLVIKIRLILCNGKYTLHTANIRNSLSLIDFTIAMKSFIYSNAVKVVHHFLGPFIEGCLILWCPPFLHVTVFIELGAGGIKAMGNFMGNNHTYTAHFFLIGIIAVIKYSVENACRNINGIVSYIVHGIDGVGRNPVYFHLAVHLLDVLTNLPF